jgi:hypothetical protein
LGRLLLPVDVCVVPYECDDLQVLVTIFESHGSITTPDIAAILNEREFRVTYETISAIGSDPTLT